MQLFYFILCTPHLVTDIRATSLTNLFFLPDSQTSNLVDSAIFRTNRLPATPLFHPNSNRPPINKNENICTACIDWVICIQSDVFPCMIYFLRPVLWGALQSQPLKFDLLRNTKRNSPLLRSSDRLKKS
jgi:hypothetical protein